MPVLVTGATGVAVGHGQGGGHPTPHTTASPIVEHMDESHDHDESDEEAEKKRRRVRLQGDFLVHCHVEMHMMGGMACVVRAIQEVTLTPALEDALGFDPPLATNDTCPDVPVHPCMHSGAGSWERLPDSPIFIVHAAMLRTGKVLLWSGAAEVGYPLNSLIWDPANPADMTNIHTYSQDLFCSGHAWLPDGRLCVAGGYVAGTFSHSRATFLFDPAAATPWTQVADMNLVRWYPTLMTLPDGRILAVSGQGSNRQEIYDAGTNTWQFVTGAERTFPELYPSLNLLPSGDVFYSRAGWAQSNLAQPGTARLGFTGPLSGLWSDLAQQ